MSFSRAGLLAQCPMKSNANLGLTCLDRFVKYTPLLQGANGEPNGGASQKQIGFGFNELEPSFIFDGK
ncbi:MAG TPA: hypothetical protein VGR78_07030 [Verrucomicrobiae bacterium]|jgi:hypothetical protein|nr:hypothetical protein [Verrucomicrobiae bacterium]